MWELLPIPTHGQFAPLISAIAILINLYILALSPIMAIHGHVSEIVSQPSVNRETREINSPLPCQKQADMETERAAMHGHHCDENNFYIYTPCLTDKTIIVQSGVKACLHG